MSLVLKVQYKDELRRVPFDCEPTIEQLESKLRAMFPQLQQFVMYVNEGKTPIASVSDFDKALEQARRNQPPLLRLQVVEGEVPVVSSESPIIEPLVQALSEVKISACAACRQSLGKTYFKCLNCLEFELCLECENKEAVHDETHLLVKLRMAVEDLPLSRQIIFKNHIEDPEDRLIARQVKKALRERKAVETMGKRKEAQSKKRAQEKLKRIALKAKAAEKLAAKKAKADKRRKLDQTKKVKKVKKIPIERKEEELSEPIPVAEPAVVSPLEVSTFVEIPAMEALEPEQPVEEVEIKVEEVKPQEKKEEFNIFKMMAEFQLLKSAKTEEQPAEPVKEVVLEPLPEPVKEEAKEELTVEEPKEIQTSSEEEVSPKEEEPKQPTLFEKNLQILEEMGFTDRERNIELLVKNVADLEATVDQLLRGPSGLARWLPFNLAL